VAGEPRRDDPDLVDTGGGAVSIMACVIPVKRSMPRESGIRVRTSDSKRS